MRDGWFSAKEKRAPPRSRFVFFLFVFLADLGEALLQRSAREHIVGQPGVVLAIAEKRLEDFPAVALARKLEGSFHTVLRMEVRIEGDLLRALARGGIARDDNASNGEVQQTVNGNPEGAAVGVHDLDPTPRAQAHHVAAAKAEGHAFLLETKAEQIVQVAFYLLLEILHRRFRLFLNAAAVHGPALVPVEQLDDVFLLEVFGAVLVRQLPKVGNHFITAQVAVVAELREAGIADAVAHAQIRRAAQLGDHLVEEFMRLFGALLRHERIGVLRRYARRNHGQEDSGEQNRPSNFPRYPHRTAPPFTLTTSPVIKVARSDARNRMGPAISSAVPGRRSGIAD